MGPVPLVLYGEQFVKDALAGVGEKNPELCQKLLIDDFQVPITDSTQDVGYDLYRSYWVNPEDCDQVPMAFQPDPVLKEVKWAPNVGQLGVENEGVAQALLKYLEINGQMEVRFTKMDGDCFFAALRRCMVCPAEFTNQHLRRYIVFRMCMFPKFFYNILRVPIAMLYGHPKLTKQQIKDMKKRNAYTQAHIDDQEAPGPFSFIEYLENILEEGFWGDDMLLVVWSLLTQSACTLVLASTPTERRIRHGQEPHWG